MQLVDRTKLWVCLVIAIVAPLIAVGQARADQPTPRGIAARSGGEMIMGQGAVPIIRNGIVEGACGVGGGTSQEDEDCARAGVERL